MALLAEEIVEEWLNRDGWFTIRGIKIGVNEIDLLAIKPSQSKIQCRHLEVQISFNPISYITQIPKQKRQPGQGAHSAKHRSREDLQESVDTWIRNKFDHPKKVELRKALYNGNWTRELVIHNIKHLEELELIRDAGNRIEFASGDYDSKAPKQASDNARWLANMLSKSTGERVAVQPIVALPGWYVTLKANSDVKVLSGKQVSKFVSTEPIQLSAKVIQQISYQLEQRCRNVSY